MNAYVKWVGIVQIKPDPNNIDVRIGKLHFGNFFFLKSTFVSNLVVLNFLNFQSPNLKFQVEIPTQVDGADLKLMDLP